MSKLKKEWMTSKQTIAEQTIINNTNKKQIEMEEQMRERTREIQRTNN